MKTLGETIAFAAVKHQNQTRINGEPYIFHPLAVYQMVRENGYGESYQKAALLHDVLEDTDATEEEVAAFGEEVLEAVKLLTRKKGIDETVYVEQVLSNHIAAIVKNFDKIHNLLDSLKSGNPDFVKKYHQKAVTFYEGKFSRALDYTIGNIPYMLREHRTEPNVPFNAFELQLYQDRQREYEQQLRDWYDARFDKPDLNYPDLSYGWISGYAIGFCAYDFDKKTGKSPRMWKLTPVGWIPLEINLVEYWDDVFVYKPEQSKEPMLKEIEDLKEDGYFADYFDPDELWK